MRTSLADEVARERALYLARRIINQVKMGRDYPYNIKDLCTTLAAAAEGRFSLSLCPLERWMRIERSADASARWYRQTLLDHGIMIDPSFQLVLDQVDVEVPPTEAISVVRMEGNMVNLRSLDLERFFSVEGPKDFSPLRPLPLWAVIETAIKVVASGALRSGQRIYFAVPPIEHKGQYIHHVCLSCSDAGVCGATVVSATMSSAAKVDHPSDREYVFQLAA